MCLAVLTVTTVPSVCDFDIRHLTMGLPAECAKKEAASASLCLSLQSSMNVNARTNLFGGEAKEWKSISSDFGQDTNY